MREANAGVAWIYYQDTSNVSIQFPYIHMKDAVEPDFNWHEYHTYQTVTPDNNPEKEIRWTAPTIDYANEGLIISASKPLYQQDQFIGLWSIDISLRFLYQRLTTDVMLGGQQNVIVDLDGRIIHHPTVEHEIDKEKGSIHRKLLSELAAPFTELDLHLMQKNGKGSFNKSSAGEEWLIIFDTVPSLKWTFIAAFPRSVLSESIRHELKTAFHRLAKGDTSFRVPDNPDADYQIIAEAYNALAQELEKSNRLRDRYERELKFTNSRLESTLNGISNPVFFIDHQYRMILKNPAASDLFERLQNEKPETEGGEPLATVFGRQNNAARCELEAALDRSGQANHLDTFQCTLHAECSPERPIEMRFTIAPSNAGHDIQGGFVVVAEDVTNEKELLEERMRSGKLESIGILAGGIAHDLNNILTAITANLSLLQMDRSPDESQALLFEEIENACDRATGLSSQLLTFSKGGKPIKKVTMLEPLIRECVDFNLRGSNVCSEFYDLEVLSRSDIDVTQINQVVQNLVINARHAMPDGGILRVTGRMEHRSDDSSQCAVPLSDGSYNIISFQDEGIGIPERYLDRIFDPYFTTKQSGSGLGLATAFSIIRNHAGHISVRSRQNEGTTFTLYLPVADTDVSSINNVTRVSDFSAIRKALVIDDDETIRNFLTRASERLNITMDAAADGELGIKLYRDALDADQPYDIVILDLTMPGRMSGLEVLSHLRGIHVSVCAIVSSGYSHDPVMSEYQKYGFKGVLPKPYTLDNLKEVLTTIQNLK